MHFASVSNKTAATRHFARLATWPLGPLGWKPGSRTTKYRHKREAVMYWAYAKHARATLRALGCH
eukprot:2119100-Lingulodinium_polyedra.AAC.1